MTNEGRADVIGVTHKPFDILSRCSTGEQVECFFGSQTPPVTIQQLYF